MIKIINNEINELIALLNEKYQEEPDVFLHIIEDCDSIEIENEMCFGAYDTNKRQIYVAGDLPDPEDVLQTITHEFAHHLQNISGSGYDEEYAEQFTFEIMEELRVRKKEKKNSGN